MRENSVLVRYYLISLLIMSSLTSVISQCVTNTNEMWCGCGLGKKTLGPCVGGECPAGYMCVCDYCCEGCMDDCYDCALFSQYCDNTNYCDLRQKCKRTCGQCFETVEDYPDDDDNNNG